MLDNNHLIIKFLGRSFKEGEFDCFDLVLQWYKELGIELPNFRHERYWEGVKIDLEDYFKNWKRIEKKELKTHDGVWFRPKRPFCSPNTEFHMGIYLGLGMFIQCRKKEGVVISRLGMFEKYIDGYYRHVRLDDGRS